MKIKAPAYIYEDIKLMLKALGGKAENIAFFGSVLDQPFEKTHDIDIAIFVKDMPLATAKQLLENEVFSLPVRIAKANGSYVAPTNKQQARDYHVVLLSQENPNQMFMSINQNHMIYLNGMSLTEQKSPLDNNKLRSNVGVAA
ncbi:MAG: hypothetical protein WC334_07060 [Kiritimatiellales bacterium]